MRKINLSPHVPPAEWPTEWRFTKSEHFKISALLEKFSAFPNNPVIMVAKNLFVSLALVAISFAQSCTVQFDGRVPRGLSLATFDTAASDFNPNSVLGAG